LLLLSSMLISEQDRYKSFWIYNFNTITIMWLYNLVLRISSKIHNVLWPPKTKFTSILIASILSYFHCHQIYQRQLAYKVFLFTQFKTIFLLFFNYNLDLNRRDTNVPFASNALLYCFSIRSYYNASFDSRIRLKFRFWHSTKCQSPPAIQSWISTVQVPTTHK
jgi:hypothetical protein